MSTLRGRLTWRLDVATEVALACSEVVDRATSLSLDDVSDRAELKRQLGEAILDALRQYKDTP